MASGTTPWTLKHLASVPYSDPPSRLRTLDIWLPQPPAGSSEKAPPPRPDSGIWLVYIHGGAWRDPLKDSHCIEPALSHLASLSSSSSSDAGSTLGHVAGVASLNYRLSPYPSHASHPSSPSDAERSARHPTHVRDVAQGLRFLQRQHAMKRWIGIGHSCGATLLSQLVSGIGLEADEQGRSSFPGGPEALILLEGIYNIPLMLRNHSPPACPQNIADIYKTFVAEAFGTPDDNGAAYLAVSPVSGKYNVQQWPEGRLLVLCHSYEDELVERAQRDVMCVALDREGWSIVMEVGDEEDEVRAEGRRVLNVRDLQGRHDWIWEDGKQIATLILDVVQRLI